MPRGSLWSKRDGEVTFRSIPADDTVTARDGVGSC